MPAVHCATALIGGLPTADVRIETSPGGVLAAVEHGVPARVGDLRLGTVLPGFVNAHSHAFHRALRGRTHADGGDFWRWRERMYAAAAALDPDTYRDLASAVFREMLAAGWTTVGEFHYVHHRPDGTPYRGHAMELALVEAAAEAGIRLVLLDVLYLESAPGVPLEPAQARFGDGSAERWLERWHALRDALPEGMLGAAIHSVRAVPPAAIATAVAGLPADVPLHAHVSEQRAENAHAVAAYGATPTRILADAGALGARFSAVHATHLTDEDVALLGDSMSTAVICPTTEADLGDGIGPAARLAAAGVVLAIGSDQHAVVDPFLELRGLEAGERLAAERRGVLAPAALLAAGTAGGARSLGMAGVADLVEVDPATARTAGADPAQLVLVATAQDVRRVVVGGRIVEPGDPGPDLARTIARLGAVRA